MHETARDDAVALSLAVVVHGDVGLVDVDGTLAKEDYRDDDTGNWRSMHPDFVFFHEVGGKIVASIVDPHGHHLPDALMKLKALATFAGKYGDAFHRIEALAEVDGQMTVLDMKREPVREAAIAGDAAKLAAQIKRLGERLRLTLPDSQSNDAGRQLDELGAALRSLVDGAAATIRDRLMEWGIPSDGRKRWRYYVAP